jgi:type IV pilus assembly protein PilW
MTALLRRGAAGGPAAGMSLVELMVGLAMGLFVVAVMSAVYLGSRSTFVAQESGSRLQENGRFVMDTMASDLRMSGFRGCLGAEPVDNTLNTPSALLYNFAEPIWGSHFTGAAWSPALSTPATTLGALPAGDLLVVRRPSGLGWSLIAEMSSTSAALTITPTAGFSLGDVLVVADCAGAAVLQATNAAPGAAGSIEHTTGGGVVPGVARNTLSRVYANDARIWRMQTLIYYLAASARRSGEVALWVYANPAYDGAAQTSELVTGVERMALTYGVDTNGDFAADRFQSADAVANWGQVVSARIELLLVGGSDARATVVQPYVFDGQTVTPADQRQRSVMSMLVSLRNAVP